MSNPLDPVLAWYVAASDALRVTRRVVEQGVAGVITDKHVFYGQSDPERLRILALAEIELDRLGVLALVATFERTVRDHLTALPVVGAGGPLQTAVRDELLKDMEMWNISSRVVELFAAVDPAVRGLVKQVIKFRNWVAHGKTLSEPAPVNTDPADAHLRLTEFLRQAGIVP